MLLRDGYDVAMMDLNEIAALSMRIPPRPRIMGRMQLTDKWV
jgi:hypothetical protein